VCLLQVGDGGTAGRGQLGREPCHNAAVDHRRCPSCPPGSSLNTHLMTTIRLCDLSGRHGLGR
jgi:hypothetical protein